MNILDQIIADKKGEVEKAKASKTIKVLEQSKLFSRPVPSFRNALLQPGPSVIAEFKRRSPSKGFINETAEPEVVLPGYERAGAAAISVLTDPYFSGNIHDLEKAAGCVGIPLLRKDFIIDEYQLIEAKSSGASAVLLIAAALDGNKLSELSFLAYSLGLDVLFEIHSERELDKCPERVSIIGVNNRNLETFEVDTGLSIKLAELIPPTCLKVSESGLSDPARIKELMDSGFDAFLIGETFMRSNDPGKKAGEFISAITKYISTGL